MRNSETIVGARAPAPRSHLRSVATILGMTFSVQAIGLFTGAVTARLLGPSGRGLLAAITVWPTAITSLGDLGGPVAYQYESASSPERRPSLVRNMRLIVPIQAAILIAITIPIMAFVLRDYPGSMATAAIFVIAFVPLNLFGRYSLGVHQGAGNFKTFNRTRLVLALSYAVGVIILLVCGVDSVEPVIAAVIVSNVCAVSAALMGLHIRDSRKIDFDRGLTKRIFSFGAKAHVGNLTPIDSLQIDVALVVVLLGAEPAGLYVVAVSAANVIRSQGTGIGMVALSGVASSGHAAQGRVIGAFFRGAGMLIVTTAALVFAFAGILVPAIYGSDFGGSVDIVRILSMGMAAAALRQVLGDCLRGAGRPVIGSVAEVVSWVVAVGGLAILVPKYEAEGAALAVSISYVVSLAVLMRASSRSGASLGDLLIPRASDFMYVRDALRRRFARRGGTQ